MNRDDLKATIRGPIAAVPTPLNADLQVDTATLEELTHWWIESGIDAETTVIKVASAVGEGPDLTNDEAARVLETVVEAAAGRVSVLSGLRSTGTRQTIEDAKRARDLGAVGVQIDLPIFHHPTQDDLVRFFTDVSDAIDIGIMVYNTWWLGAPSISAASVKRLADAEHVVAVKWCVPPGEDYDAMREFAHIVNVIDNSQQPARCHRNGGRGFLSPTIPAYPAHDLELWRLLEEQRYDEAQERFDRVDSALLRFNERSDAHSGGYRVVKGIMEAMGHPVGPPHPPTLPLGAAELAELRDILTTLGWPLPSATATAA